MKNLLILGLMTISTIVSASTLSDISGTYSLVNKRGDDGQFTPECTEELQVVYSSASNSVTGTFLRSNSSITGIAFKNINSGTVQEYGEKGVRNTTFSQNQLTEVYKAGSVFSKYTRVKSISLNNKMLTLSIESSDGEMDMECTYRK